MSGVKGRSGNRTHAPRAPGAGRPRNRVLPPRIGNYGGKPGYLIFNVSGLKPSEIERLMIALRPFWKPSPAGAHPAEKELK